MTDLKDVKSATAPNTNNTKYAPELVSQLLAEFKYLTQDEQQEIFNSMPAPAMSGSYNKSQIEFIVNKVLSKRDILEDTAINQDGEEVPVLSLPGILQRIYAYDGKGNKIYLRKSLAISSDQNVWLGELISFDKSINRKEVVLKWSLQETQVEIDNWATVKWLGIPTPIIDGNFKLMDFPVIVLARLYPLDATDDPYKVGKSVLKDLSKLHKVCCHSDLKPDNIMKFIPEDKKAIYYIIDYGSTSTEKLYYGYRRRVWTPLYKSQVPMTNQVTTAKYDLLELLFTINSLLIQKERKVTENKLTQDDITEITSNDVNKAPLVIAYNLLMQYPENKVPSNIYDKLSIAFDQPPLVLSPLLLPKGNNTTQLEFLIKERDIIIANKMNSMNQLVKKLSNLT